MKGRSGKTALFLSLIVKRFWSRSTVKLQAGGPALARLFDLVGALVDDFEEEVRVLLGGDDLVAP